MPLEALSSVEPRPVEWLWHPFVPLGKFTDLAGPMGQGKSQFTLWLAARVTTQPDPGSVLLYGEEDDHADTVVPRLEAAGADLSRVHRVTGEHVLTVDKIAAHCDELGDVALVVADPITAWTNVNVWKTPAVRQFLQPIAALAQQRRFALVGVQHFNRGDSDDPLARIADAQGFPQVARSVLAWGPHPDDPDGESGNLRALAVAKTNLVRGRPAATFRQEDGEAPKVAHVGNSTVTARQVVGGTKARTLTDEAETWLASYLSSGPQLRADVYAAAKAQGITEKPLRAASARLVTSQRRDPHDKRTPYVWRLST